MYASKHSGLGKKNLTLLYDLHVKIWRHIRAEKGYSVEHSNKGTDALYIDRPLVRSSVVFGSLF